VERAVDLHAARRARRRRRRIDRRLPGLLNVQEVGNIGVFIKGSSMAEIEGLVRALREGDDAAKLAAVRALGDLAWDDGANKIAIAEAGGITPLVDLLRDGSAEAKEHAAGALGTLTISNNANQAAIAEAGAIPLLVELLRDGSADAKRWAARALRNLAWNNNANKVAVAEAGGILPLVQLVRDGSAVGKTMAAAALRNLARNNDANAVAIAAAVGSLEALVELARSGRVTVNERRIVRNAGIAAKRKAALVVAALLRACVPVEVRSRADVRDVIRGVVGPYL
jgi:vacuolar protein 8